MALNISCGTSVTLRSVEALRETLLDGFAEQSAVDLDVSALEEVDLSFVQLVEAARVHASRENATIRLVSPANPALAALLARAGFLTQPSADDIDFWFHGELPQ